MKEKIIDRIQKLINMAEGAKEVGSFKEAQSFAAKAQEMLMEHNLSMSEIEDFEDDPIEEEMFRAEDFGVEREWKFGSWKSILASMVARNNFCESMYFRDKRRIVFIGRKTDRMAAMMVYSHLARFAIDEARITKAFFETVGESTKDFYKSFFNGFVRAIGLRYKEQKEDFEDDALMVLNNQLKKIDEWIDQNHNTTSRKAGERSHNAAAFQQGLQKGEEADLNTPKQKLLK